MNYSITHQTYRNYRGQVHQCMTDIMVLMRLRCYLADEYEILAAKEKQCRPLKTTFSLPPPFWRDFLCDRHQYVRRSIRDKHQCLCKMSAKSRWIDSSGWKLTIAKFIKHNHVYYLKLEVSTSVRGFHQKKLVGLLISSGSWQDRKTPCQESGRICVAQYGSWLHHSWPVVLPFGCVWPLIHLVKRSGSLSITVVWWQLPIEPRIRPLYFGCAWWT